MNFINYIKKKIFINYKHLLFRFIDNNYYLNFINRYFINLLF